MIIIMPSMVRSNNDVRSFDMSEKVYKTMSMAGAGNIAIGIVMLISGITCGILAIVSGAKILKRKSDIIF